jgi:hypothetical protein
VLEGGPLTLTRAIRLPELGLTGRRQAERLVRCEARGSDRRAPARVPRQPAQVARGADTPPVVAQDDGSWGHFTRRHAIALLFMREHDRVGRPADGEGATARTRYQPEECDFA